MTKGMHVDDGQPMRFGDRRSAAVFADPAALRSWIPAIIKREPTKKAPSQYQRYGQWYDWRVKQHREPFGTTEPSGEHWKVVPITQVVPA